VANSPIDPATGAPVALSGRVVTMDDARTVVEHGVVYATNGSIVDVRAAGDPAPDGFAEVAVVASGGTICPGLIELHNHLPYDVLGLWAVPKRYTNRDQWSGSSTPDYHRLITGPMQVLGADPLLVPAVVRYVELRCLLGGTTTSQGVTLASASGIIKHFRGLVRNVEETGDPALPAAATHIADVDAANAERFLERISSGRKMILHLAEGTDTAAHDHFAALQIGAGRWAITHNLIGIHCVALTGDDFAVLAAHGGSMVWSPLSNLLLYGSTADIASARAHGVPLALGSDWSPSGSKNLLGELKVARLAARAAGVQLGDADLVAMATRTPAGMLGWAASLGSLERGKRADLIVVHGHTGDPYTQLVDATEADLSLVMINGVPRAGTPALMTRLGVPAGSATVTVGGHARVLHLEQAGADPDVEQLDPAQAISRLTEALHDLPQRSPARLRRAAEAARVGIRLAVAGLVDNAQSPRPHLPLRGRPTGPNLPATRTVAAALAEVTAAGPLPALTLDPLTAVDNPAFFSALSAEPNLPDDIRKGLAAHLR
jgi:cytosine/adenosine deaminase-related metal-dependent hydrolase